MENRKEHETTAGENGVRRQWKKLPWTVREKTARERMRREMELAEHLATARGRDCVIAHASKLRPEFLVRGLRDDPPPPGGVDDGLHEIFVRTLFGPVDDSRRRPHAAAQITRAIRKKAWHVRYLRQPMEPADFEDFSQNAYMLILEGVHSTDRSWEDVFRVPLSRRLWNLVRDTRIALGRQGLTGNPEKGKTYARMPPMLLLEKIENTAAQNTETTDRGEILDRAVVALKAALSRLHPWLQAALEVDEVGRLVPAHHVALEYDRNERTVKQWRARARRLFRQDQELVALLRELGFRVKEDA